MLEEFKECEVYCIQAGELELMASFARKHNQECPYGLKPSDEDGQPYCRYRVAVSNSGIGQNFHLVCRECGRKEYCGQGHNA